MQDRYTGDVGNFGKYGFSARCVDCVILPV